MRIFTNAPSVRMAALASLVALGACSKKDDGGTPTPATTYATTWAVDGKTYTATVSNAGVSNNNLLIGATQTVSSNEAYSITLGVPAAAGTYTIGSSTVTAGYSTSLAGTNTGYIAASGFGSGTIVVSTFSATEIIGTFTFTGLSTSNGTSTKAVTNGKFAIKR